ncbi:ankyrin repeat domain-containing protein [Sodalis sp. RH22]|uniref:ankyrin repeat domain-containing protein n=1 Tax=unclassified Sodalis (in: enterobacteria) TaxID=2636512 RepID=UPI0039B5BCC1
MNGCHQLQAESLSIIKTNLKPLQQQNDCIPGLKSCVSIKNNCIALYFDRLPKEIIGDILGRLPVPDLIRLSQTTPDFEAESQRILNLLQEKSKSEIYFQLVASGDDSALRTLIKLGQNLGHSIDHETGNTLLHEAVNANQPTVMEALLESGTIDVNTKNLTGFTPLLMAVKKEDIVAVNKLINAPGINMNISYDISDRGIYGFGEYDFVFALSHKYNSGATALHFAVDAGNVEVFDAICKNENTDVNIVDQDGNTALMKAIFKKQNEMVRQLLKRNDIILCQQDQRCRELLHTAVLGGNDDILPDLLETLADVNIEDRRGDTALHIAVIKGAKETVDRLLTASKINIDARNRGLWTPQQIAHSGGLADIVRLLEQRRLRDRRPRTSESVEHHSGG